MIPYITLALIVGASLGFIAHRHLVKQQLKTKSMRIGMQMPDTVFLQ